MSIRVPHALYAKHLPMPRQQDELPPFWELEDLISAGFERDAALAILALRRERRERGSSSVNLSDPSTPVGADDLSDIAF